MYLHVVLKGAIYANYNNLFLFSANLTIGLSNPIFPTDDVVSVGKIIINMKFIISSGFQVDMYV